MNPLLSNRIEYQTNMAFVYMQPRWRINKSPLPAEVVQEEVKSPLIYGKQEVTGNSGYHVAKKPVRSPRRSKKLQNSENNTFEEQNNHEISQLPTRFIIHSNQRKNSTLLSPPLKKDLVTCPIAQGDQIFIPDLKNGGFLKVSSLNSSDNQLFSKQEKTKLNENNLFVLASPTKNSPSIKPCSAQNFYIGSKNKDNQDLKKSSKNAVTLNCQRKKSAMRCNAALRNRYTTQQFIQNETQFDQQIIQKQPTKSKSKCQTSYVKSSIGKKDLIEQEADEKFEQKSTGLQEDDEPTEYDADAMPGPGSYDLDAYHNFAKNNKKHLLYTDTSFKRFQDIKPERNYFRTATDNAKSTLVSSSGSRASQRKVGFGRCVSSKNYNQQPKSLCEEKEYLNSNINSIQQKAIRNKLKDALNPGFFNSKMPRFCQPPTLIITQNQDQQCIQQKISDLKVKNENDRPNYPFTSKVTRKQDLKCLTENVNFGGQAYQTIQSKTSQICDRSKYLQSFVDKDRNEQGCKQPAQLGQAEEKDKNITEIKYGLVETNYGYRSRQWKGVGKQSSPKFGFRQAKTSTNSPGHEREPSPLSYEVKAVWSKPSFNRKFMEKENKKL